MTKNIIIDVLPMHLFHRESQHNATLARAGNGQRRSPYHRRMPGLRPLAPLTRGRFFFPVSNSRAPLTGVASRQWLDAIATLCRPLALVLLATSALPAHADVKWTTHGGTYDEQRYSPADQIDTKNVETLELSDYE